MKTRRKMYSETYCQPKCLAAFSSAQKTITTSTRRTLRWIRMPKRNWNEKRACVRVRVSECYHIWGNDAMKCVDRQTCIIYTDTYRTNTFSYTHVWSNQTHFATHNILINYIIYAIKYIIYNNVLISCRHVFDGVHFLCSPSSPSSSFAFFGSSWRAIVFLLHRTRAHFHFIILL